MVKVIHCLFTISYKVFQFDNPSLESSYKLVRSISAKNTELRVYLAKIEPWMEQQLFQGFLWTWINERLSVLKRLKEILENHIARIARLFFQSIVRQCQMTEFFQ